jgi:hypothetical protein
MKVILISCVKTKRGTGKWKAKDLYISTWFQYAFRYAQSLCPNKIFVISARYFLTDQDAEIEYYEETLKSKSDSDIRTWANKVVTELRQQTDLEKDTFIILAGKKYRKYLVPHLSNYYVPMEGLGIGRQLRWLKDHCTR